MNSLPCSVTLLIKSRISKFHYHFNFQIDQFNSAQSNMANRFLCTLALIAVAGVLVEGNKITCSNKKPVYTALALKFSKCAAYISKENEATSCIVEVISSPPDFTKCSSYLESIVPAADKAMVKTEITKCKSQFTACKPKKEDKTGASCASLKDCVFKIFDKICKT